MKKVSILKYSYIIIIINKIIESLKEIMYNY